MKKWILMLVALMLVCAGVYAQDGTDVAGLDFLTGFASFYGLATLIVPAIVGFIAGKLKKPMNRWVCYWVTALVGVAATFFSWWMGLGFPPADASVATVSVDALFVALASTGIVSVATSEWLAKLLGNKTKE